MRRQDQRFHTSGFTLVEIMVVIIIIGLLATIAYLNLSSAIVKGKESEARLYVGTVNRAQQTYFFENQVFARDLSDLVLGLKQETNYYSYDVVTVGRGRFARGHIRAHSLDWRGRGFRGCFYGQRVIASFADGAELGDVTTTAVLTGRPGQDAVFCPIPLP